VEIITRKLTCDMCGKELKPNDRIAKKEVVLKGGRPAWLQLAEVSVNFHDRQNGTSNGDLCSACFDHCIKGVLSPEPNKVKKVAKPAKKVPVSDTPVKETGKKASTKKPAGGSK
jgi:hypothetical protein